MDSRGFFYVLKEPKNLGFPELFSSPAAQI